MFLAYFRPEPSALVVLLGGFDLSNPLDGETFAGVRAAFAEHPVLVFRDQNLEAPELAAVSRRVRAEVGLSKNCLLPPRGFSSKATSFHVTMAEPPAILPR